MMRKKIFSWLFWFMLVWLAPPLHASPLTIEIVGGGANQIPVSIVPFAGEDGLPQGLTRVISDDLTRSGLFRLVEPGAMAPHEPQDVRYPDWRTKGADALVIGTVQPAGNGQWRIQFRLLDVARQLQLAGVSYTVAPAQLRATAHRIADQIYEKLTGDVGVFSTRIAYIVKSGKRFQLQIADADGANPQTMLASDEPIISPAWSPDGRRLAYVSFESRKPVVYVQDVGSGRRQVVANFKGNNSAPAWSPDGRRLAVVLTRDGLSQIYLISADGSGGAQRLTHSGGIDTEPNWSPDGQSLVFTSDRGGSPQIYRISASGGDARRVSFEGAYNATARHSPDGKSLTLIQRAGGRFHVAVLDLASGQLQVLTDTPQDESPSFAPNGKMILYATVSGGRGVLYAVSSDGRVKQRLSLSGGNVREPAWGPLLRD